MNTDEFRFAVMGAGHIAHKFCDAARLVKGCAVVAVASKSPDRARAFAKEERIPAAYGNYERMLDEIHPDCVYIATTADAHYSLSRLCVEKGCPVLCEKAMFIARKEAEDLFGLSRKRGVFAMEALWSRFLPANAAAREWLRQERIGRVSTADFSIGFVAPPDPDNRYFNPDLGGGAAYDLTVYGLQILTWVLDRNISVARAVATPAPTGVDGSSVVALSLEGLPAAVRSSLLCPMSEGMTVYGDRGHVLVPHAHYADEAILFDERGREIDHFRDATTINGFTYEIEEVIRCVRAGLCESPVVPHASTLACAGIYDLIRAALK